MICGRWFVTAGLLACIGCKSSGDRASTSGSATASSPPPPASASAAQQQELAAIAADPRFRLKQCAPELKARATAVARALPANAQAVETARMTLTACDDWEQLSTLLRAHHAAVPSDSIELQIIAAELQAQRWDTALELALPLARRPSPSFDARRLAGLALYSAGRRAEARPFLEAVEADSLAHCTVDVVELLGMIALDDGRLDEAKRRFETAIQKAPTTILARHGLGRTLARQGNTTGAAEQFARARELQDQISNEETRRSKLTSMSRDVTDAIGAGRREEARKRIDEMLPLANANERAQLQELRATLEAKR